MRGRLFHGMLGLMTIVGTSLTKKPCKVAANCPQPKGNDASLGYGTHRHDLGIDHRILGFNDGAWVNIQYHLQCSPMVPMHQRMPGMAAKVYGLLEPPAEILPRKWWITFISFIDTCQSRLVI